MTDVLRWTPQRWDDVLGCQELVEHFQDFLRAANDGDFTGVNTAVFGPSRTGKTSSIRLFVRALMCQKRDPATLNPCRGLCRPCSQEASLFGFHGIDAVFAADSGSAGKPIHFVPVDCTSITENELRTLLIDFRDYSGLRVVYLDEAHRLHRRFMDEQLLKPVEDCRGYMWIISSATTGELEKMFQNRFVKIKTTLPTVEQLSVWIAQRCHEWGIAWDDPHTLIRLATKAQLIPGLTLQVLARAYKRRPPCLTMELVERHVFDVDG